MARAANYQKIVGRYDYQHCYCEENIWRMLKHKDFEAKACWALFISNPQRSVAFWHARGAQPGKPLVWDYHCIMLCKHPNWFAWDLDTNLGLPCPLRAYLEYSFPAIVEAAYAPLFRLVPAQTYLAEFSSDRSHMRNSSGVFLAEPPLWAPIFDGLHSNLERWLDMGAGSVRSLKELMDELGL